MKRVLFALLWLPFPCWANAQDTLLASVTHYLNSLSTLKAQFTQRASDGSLSKGKLYMKRPGRLRVEYAKPSSLLMVADGSFLAQVDTKNNTAWYAPLRSTPLYIFLRPQIRLKKTLEVLSLKANLHNITLRVAQKNDRDEGSLLLYFSRAPLTLQSWSVIDAQNRLVTVTLHHTRFRLPLPDHLFEFDPRWQKSPHQHPTR